MSADDRSDDPGAELALAVRLSEALGEIHCLTFVRGLDPEEALIRAGADPESLRPRTRREMAEEKYSFDDGYPLVASATPVGDWCALFEPEGFQGSSSALLSHLSVGTEAVSVLRHDYAHPSFMHADDGAIIVNFEPTYVAPVHGTDPTRFARLQEEVGLQPGSDDDYFVDDAEARALVLAQRIVGGSVTEADLENSLSGHLLPQRVVPQTSFPIWPVAVWDRRDPGWDRLAEAVEKASPDARQRATAAEAGRLAGVLGLADTPGLDTLLEAAARGAPVDLHRDRGIGPALARWVVDSRRAGETLNGDRQRMTDQERDALLPRGWLTTVLFALAHADTLAAARSVFTARHVLHRAHDPEGDDHVIATLSG